MITTPPATLLAVLRETAQQQTRKPLTADQIEARLLEAYAAIHAAPPEVFAPGDIVWVKLPHLSPYRSPEDPLVFIGYLDKPIEGEELLGKPNHLSFAAAAATVDCRVGCLCGGDSFHLHLIPSRDLTATRPHRPARAEAETEADGPVEAPQDMAAADGTDSEEREEESGAAASPWTHPAPTVIA